MNILKITLVLAATLTGTSAFAAYTRLAECDGRTDKGTGAAVTLLVNRANDTTGLIVFGLEDGSIQASDTKIDWNSNPQGFPRFYDNEYDLDIVINDSTVSTDDILVGENYVGVLNCTYRP